jgi:hypothetical protein
LYYPHIATSRGWAKPEASSSSSSSVSVARQQFYHNSIDAGCAEHSEQQKM